MQNNGIDEAFLDITEVPGSSEEIARRIKQAIFDATGLTSSIGIAPNKLLAKIASELDKPDGLTILTADDIVTRIWPLPAKRINGVGPKTNAKLEALGVKTIGDLAAANRDWLVEHLGAHQGAWLHDAAHGRDERPVVTESEPRSISRELTFERDLHAQRDRDELSAIFTHLCEGVARDLQRKRYVGRTIGIKLRFDNFRTVTRDRTIETPTRDVLEIRKAARECLKRVDLQRRIRLLGVRIGSLVPESRVQAVAEPDASLFANPTPET